MNIFMTSLDPVQCAADLDDLRVVNQLRETCQLLSGAVHHAVHDLLSRVTIVQVGAVLGYAPEGEGTEVDLSWMYSPTHLASPCAQWVRANRQNFQWTVDHALALANQYLLRYPTGSHKSVLIAHRFLAGREYLGALFPLHAILKEVPGHGMGSEHLEASPIKAYDGAANQSLGLDFRVSVNYPRVTDSTLPLGPDALTRTELVTSSYRRYLSERYRLAELAGRPPRWSAPASRPEWSL